MNDSLEEAGKVLLDTPLTASHLDLPQEVQDQMLVSGFSSEAKLASSARTEQAVEMVTASTTTSTVAKSGESSVETSTTTSETAVVSSSSVGSWWSSHYGALSHNLSKWWADRKHVEHSKPAADSDAASSSSAAGGTEKSSFSLFGSVRNYVENKVKEKAEIAFEDWLEHSVGFCLFVLPLSLNGFL